MAATITVITICYNNPEELKSTCAAVDRQTTPPHEHWIIDGSSGAVIREWLQSVPQPPYRKWICEPDQGIADAFNKGVQRATGNIVNMLNSADYYCDEHTLSQVASAFASHPQISWLHGKYRLQRGGLWVTIGKPFERGLLYRGMRSLSHQSMFVKKALHDRYGLYDTSLKNAMDYDFVCRIANEPMLFLQEPLVVFAPGGTSYTNYRSALKEARLVYEKYFGYSLKLVLWQARLKLLHYLLNSAAGRWLYKLKVWLRLENM